MIVRCNKSVCESHITAPAVCIWNALNGTHYCRPIGGLVGFDSKRQRSDTAYQSVCTAIFMTEHAKRLGYKLNVMTRALQIRMERVEGHSASVAGAGVVLATRMATVLQILEA